MIGLVKLIAQHSAMKLAKKGYFTAYRVCRLQNSTKQSVRGQSTSVRPSYIFRFLRIELA
jgi:hypothetical protein